MFSTWKRLRLCTLMVKFNLKRLIIIYCMYDIITPAKDDLSAHPCSRIQMDTALSKMLQPSIIDSEYCRVRSDCVYTLSDLVTHRSQMPYDSFSQSGIIEQSYNIIVHRTHCFLWGHPWKSI